MNIYIYIEREREIDQVFAYIVVVNYLDQMSCKLVLSLATSCKLLFE